jgi:hypothetical protein
MGEGTGIEVHVTIQIVVWHVHKCLCFKCATMCDHVIIITLVTTALKGTEAVLTVGDNYVMHRNCKTEQ